MPKTPEETTNNFDSSDSENEREMKIKHGIVDHDSYVNYLMREIIQPNSIDNADELSKRLGLALENYADRAFNAGPLREKHKELKQELIPISEEEYYAVANWMQDFAQTLQPPSDMEIPLENLQYNDALAAKHIQFYNYIFNNNVGLPEGILPHLKEEGVRSFLKTRLQIFAINNPFPIDFRRNNELTFHLPDNENAFLGVQLLAFSQTVGRRDRREGKPANVQRTTNKSISSITHGTKSKDEAIKTDMSSTLYGKSAKGRTLVSGIGAYKDGANSVTNIFNKFGPQVVASAVKDFVTNTTTRQEMMKAPDDDTATTSMEGKSVDKSQQEVLNTKTLQRLAHLMFVAEVQRNRTTAFTAPMFLDMVPTDHVDFDKFPMAMKQAVDACRAVKYLHDEKLPVHRSFDEGEVQKKGKRLMVAKTILVREGFCFINWLKNNGNTDLVRSWSALKYAADINELKDKSVINTQKLATLCKNIADLKIDGIPENEQKFYSWVMRNDAEQTLKNYAICNLSISLSNSINLLNVKILNGWYHIDHDQLYHNIHTTQKSSINHSDSSSSDNENNPKKEQRTSSSPVFDVATFVAETKAEGRIEQNNKAIPEVVRTTSNINNQKQEI